MSLSFLNSIFSPPQIDSVFCSSNFSLNYFHSSSFSSLYHRKQSYENGKIIRGLGFLGDWKGAERVNSGSMGKKKAGLFWISSFCSSRGSSSCSSSKDEEFESKGEEEEEEEEEEGHGSFCVLPDRWDVLGLGQAMVDFSGMVDDEFLERLGLEKGTRKVVNHEERGRVLRAMDGCSYKAAAGGSLSNSLVALARLGSKPIEGPALNVAMAGSIGSDPLGGFYRAKLHRANVNFLSEPIKDGTTGTVIVLTTPDAQRTMLAYQACEEARRSGALVAVTASDVSCIERHYDDFWEIVGNYADIVFANSEEARALCHFSSRQSPISATRYLSHFVPLVSVTDGRRGSYIGVRGEAVYVPPSPCVPVDTCGAGDAYASGILYGILRGISDLKGMGTLAARIAATVVGQQGTRLRVQDAVDLAKSFAFNLESSTARSDVGSNHISSF
ncbi:uncharacterized protein LOC111293689 isoform X2 [Durio zibethinus]|uniref:Uncharacterized protein LOC111293689 isoform X2 n=1 Tax=Durio zibethinus TaxID=66656 RepID=A0A6P5YPS8_DURZI|nr:uncharacterized protein LOC111293689 isoform X2 [Durio zibethinus]